MLVQSRENRRLQVQTGNTKAGQQHKLANLFELITVFGNLLFLHALKNRDSLSIVRYVVRRQAFGKHSLQVVMLDQATG